MGCVGENQEVKKMLFEETVKTLEFDVCVGRFSLALFCLLVFESFYVSSLLSDQGQSQAFRS